MRSSWLEVPFITIFLSVMLFSCDEASHDDRGELRVSSAKISIGTKQLTDYRVYDHATIDGFQTMIGYNPQVSSLDFFDVTNRQFIEAKPIERSGPDAVSDVVSFSIRNDSIVWFATVNNFILYDLARQKTIRVHSLKDLNDRFSLARYSYFFDNRGRLVALNDSTVVLSAAHFPLYDGNSNLQLASLNVNSGKVEGLDPKIPKWINAANHYGGLNTIHYYHENGEIVYNFPFIDSVFTWSLNDYSIMKERYASEIIPSVSDPYQGDSSMESIIYASSRSNYYTGIQPVTGTKTQYRFVVSADGEDEVDYTTSLEIFNGPKRSHTFKLSPWTKTRGFTSKDSIFLFIESGNENQLEFAVFTGF